MRMAIVGSTCLYGNDMAIQIIEDAINRHNPTLIVSGDADGIDKMANEIAQKRGIKFMEYPSLSQTTEGYMASSKMISENCDVLIRIISSKTKAYVSEFARDEAKKNGAITEDYLIPQWD